MTDPDQIDWHTRYMAEREKITRHRNHFHVVLSNALRAADTAHVAMCLVDCNHVVQSNLNETLHSALIAAETCRQALKDC